MGKEKLRDLRRSELLTVLSAHVLKHGLPSLSLRPLAAAAGTSDRMLLYYFKDKEELLATLLTHIAATLSGQLDEQIPRPLVFATLLTRVSELVRTPQLTPYMHLWLDLAALSARGHEPYRSIGGAIADGFLVWVASRLRVRREEDRQSHAALLLSLIEGQLLFDSFARPNIADLALPACNPR